jgi:glucan phosphoethanolaminetransferase (alkaline phosphatase superfamily)
MATRELKSFLSPILVFILALYPNFAYFLTQDAGSSYLLTSLLYALPLLSLLLIIRNQIVFYSIVVLVTICTLLEYTMVMLFDNYVVAGNILAILMTDTTEGTEFIQANAHICWHWIPILILSVLSIYLYNVNARRNFKICILFILVSIILPSVFVKYKINNSYKNKLTYEYFIPTRILNRPPYNVPYQIYNIVKIQQVKKSIKETEDFTFNASKQVSDKREIHVLAIGESMRFDKLSLNGYNRKTTPLLDNTNNLISFKNYYSTACLTMFSVPQIVTRATPLDYELNYKEKGIIQAFKDVGFKTYVIVAGGNLLSYEKYLTQGTDSLIILSNRMVGSEEVSGDRDIVVKMDSLIKSSDDNIFFIVEFKGNHHPYTNYESNYDVWKPNFKTSADVKSDSLYINAYDNSMLYQDWILSGIINKIEEQNIVSTFTFVSDHGENITLTGGGHGGDCSPIKTEYHVPFLFWYSDTYASNFPKKVELAKSRKDVRLNADNIFYSVCDVAGINLDSIYSHTDYSIFSENFEEHERYVLLPDGINYIMVD